MSILLSTTRPGRSSRPPYAASSASIASEVGQRVALDLGRRRVQHVHQHRGALDVPQELHARALAGGRARDQARARRPREGLVAGLHHAQVGHQRGERVVGDLRLGRGHHRDQRRLAGRREADQAHVGDALELEHHVERSPGSPSSAKPGTLRRGVGQRGVARAAAAAAGHLEAGARADQVGQHLAVRGLHDRAVRHLSTRSVPFAPSRLPPIPPVPLAP
jgi:hypothetical protein